MPIVIAASMLAALVTATPPLPPTLPPPSANVSENWAAPPPPSREAIASAVREVIAEENKKRGAASEYPVRSLRSKNQNSLDARFEEAVVPGCLRPDGLKRQPTSIGPFGVTGVLALPFIMVAKLRGKCN